MEYMAAQQKRAVCLMGGCEGLLLDECCQRGGANERNNHHNLL